MHNGNRVRVISRFAAWAVLAAIGAATIGCGAGGRETITVTGVVTLDGQALASAAVMFSGPEGGSPVTTSTDAAGKFTIQAVPGMNNVAVSKTSTSGGPTPLDDGTMPADGIPSKVETLVPVKYADFRTSGLSVDVKAGLAEVRLELSSQ